ncbi:MULTISPECIES: GntR family transcriptional regulator [Variovorax]|uniref:GntR family transcriptional regulator n=1 Tax=Variovorax boronicumulans TaxID=436515 RepID=A0A250DKD2_9BURK|nr:MULTISPECIES: GntR family transcriptional regulator [Variovorax]ATA54815.1 GntR family transcriptional regulator [Variovorax boronicumulans]MDP9881129.1 DNA-binding GntR family transcriptional regulator [Variovorax boronicumulans]MDP9920624.1 DNA-binding GntR family transcriptional regulator [Variovorax boronicumulans]MDP9926416.1 DNA-binding GntR family transcriptional regulator [Variovorax boronicumulans]PBI89762.1 putative HTH-type transcriptional regulator YdfH [Variovorax boronicumulan
MNAATPARKAPVRRPEAAISLNETAYLRLKEALVTLAYKPGEYLNTAQVMERLGVGRTPVNQALHRLSAEGLVRIIPRKGAMASPLSINDALELIEVRLVNEVLCMRLAAAAITEAELAELQAIAEQFEAAAQRRDAMSVMNLDRLFHEKIAAAARNAMLQDILSVLHARSQRFWAISLAAEGHLAEVIEEHRTIVATLQRHDADAAAEAAKTHVLSFKASMLNSQR